MKIKQFFFYWCLFFCALIIRCIHLLYIQGSVLFNYFIGDEITHLKWMKLIVDGELTQVVPFFRAPLYGYFLSMFWQLFNHSFYFLYLIQFVLGSFTVLLVFLIGKKLFSFKIGLIASIIYALYPVSIYYEGQFLITSLFVFLSTASLYFLTKMHNYKTKEIIISACFLALASLSRPNILVFVGFLLGYWILQSKYKVSIILLLFYLLVITPFSVMNLKIGKTPAFISTQGGINFYAGNNLNADGLIPAAPNFNIDPAVYRKEKLKLKQTVWNYDNIWETSQIIPRVLLKRDLNEAQTSSWWYQHTFKLIIQQPFRWLGLILKKTVFLISNYEPPNNTDLKYAFDNFFPVLKFLYNIFNFSYLWALFLPGCYFAIQDRLKVQILFIYLITMSLVIVMFFVNARFRVPLIPVMVLFSSVTVDRIWRYFKLLKWQKLQKLILCVLLGVSSSYAYKLYPDSYLIKASKALYHNALAKAYIKNQDSELALKEINLALTYNTKENFIFLLTKANIYLKLKDDSLKAIDLLDESIAFKSHPTTLFALAKLYYKEKEFDKSKEVLVKLLQEFSEHQGARKMLETAPGF